MQMIRATLKLLLDAEKYVVLVKHSYGGLAGSCSIKDLTKSPRELLRLKGGVASLLFISSFLVPKEGISALAAGGGHYPPDIEVKGDCIYNKDPRNTFFNDLSESEATPLLKKVTHQCRAAFGTEVPYDPWGTVPATYLVCGQDNCFPVEFQEYMANGTGEITIERCNSGHFPHVSMPDHVSELIVKLVKEM